MRGWRAIVRMLVLLLLTAACATFGTIVFADSGLGLWTSATYLYITLIPYLVMLGVRSLERS